MQILFVGDFRYNSGSSHAVLNYCRVAEQYGSQVKISDEYGSLDQYIRDHMPLCNDITWADQVIFVFEANQYLTAEQIATINRLIPRNRITIIDPDGRYNATIQEKDDSNHDRYPDVSWKLLFDALTDRILQPCLSSVQSGVQFFPYFGMETRKTRGLSRDLCK